MQEGGLEPPCSSDIVARFSQFSLSLATPIVIGPSNSIIGRPPHFFGGYRILD